MTPRLSQREFDLFRGYIEKSCGITLSDDKKYLIETRLASLVFETGASSFTEFYQKVDDVSASQLRSKIIDAMTTNETLWFRDGSPWVALRDHILPELESRFRPGQPLRFWSAACSTGQEPYSMAMLLSEYAGPGRRIHPGNVEIVATDISKSALLVAQRGRYDRISMNRGFTGEWSNFKTKYFTGAGAVAEIDPKIRQRVRFVPFNLQESLMPLGSFDVVFLRNVAIYFSDAFRRELFNKIANILNPGGLLILGSAETIHGYSTRFKSATFGRAIAYRLQ